MWPPSAEFTFIVIYIMYYLYNIIRPQLMVALRQACRRATGAAQDVCSETGMHRIGGADRGKNVICGAPVMSKTGV